MATIRFIIILFCVSLLSGCLSPQKTVPSSSYTLTDWPNKVVIPKQSQTKATLLVTQPVASPGYQTSRMVYVMVPYQLKSYADHRWVAPPASLILPLLANRLRVAGYFQSVVEAPFSGSATYEVNTQLLLLQQEFLRPQSVVRLALEVTLINMVTGQVLASRVFETTVPASNDPYSGVLATNKAVHQLLGRVAGFVVRQVSGIRG